MVEENKEKAPVEAEETQIVVPLAQTGKAKKKKGKRKGKKKHEKEPSPTAAHLDEEGNVGDLDDGDEKTDAVAIN